MILKLFEMSINDLLQNKSMKYHFIAFCFKLLRCIKEDVSGCQSDADIDTLEETMFSQRENGDYYDGVNMRHIIRQIGKDQVEILPDKMMSTNRFRPKGGEAKKSFIPFVGGASGTTRDISRDLMNNGLLWDEKEYWRFQLANASFMILNNYHSFMEVIFRAAAARIEFKKARKELRDTFGFDTISKGIMDYFMHVAQWQKDDPALNEQIIIEIVGTVNNPSYQPIP